MAVAIKPIRHRRRTVQRGKPISQSKRWGKVTTMTPVPEGIISTSTGPVDPSQEVVQEVVQVEEATPELVEEVLPEVTDDAAI